MTPALHSSTLELPGGETRAMGLASGYLVRVAGKTIYHAGDTGLFGDMSLIGRHGIDVALIPIGDFYTMGPADAIDALGLLRPKLTVPMHYNTFPAIRQDAEAFARKAQQNGHAVRVMKPGETLELTT
jgi:L-ascorbate metabolism protein UlaG (beta-lactamase superfamily)